jgi:anti-sigma factor RsiW
MITNMITKENYEEFFLLYIDNELPVSVRHRVEQFVADNPDLKEEWEALLQCRIQPEQALAFREKGDLLRYESELISYIDGELGQQEREAVEALVKLYPSKAVELQQLQMTVSHPDPGITCPDKESLYRRENTGKVVFWLRMGVAAAVLLAVALLLLPRRNDKGSAPSIAANKKSSPVVTPPGPPALHTQETGNRTTKTERPDKHRDMAISPSIARSAPRHAQTPATTDSVKRHGDASGDVSDNAEARSDKAVTDGNAGNTSVAGTGKELTPAAPVTAVVIPREESSFATQALMEEAQGIGSENFAAAPASPAKSKFRGLLRKVTRAFEKTADRDSEGQKEVLISAFQVALK